MSDYFTRDETAMCHLGVVMGITTRSRALLEVDGTMGKTPFMMSLAA